MWPNISDYRYTFKGEIALVSRPLKSLIMFTEKTSTNLFLFGNRLSLLSKTHDYIKVVIYAATIVV